jgi:tetratricopeptide (TPR) repeat protein
MKAFVLLFAILTMASAAPAMACAISTEQLLPERYREPVRGFADKTVQELGSQNTPDARLKLAKILYAASKRPGPGDCGSPPAGEKIAFYDEIERRFGDDKSPKMRAIVLKALIAKTDLAHSYRQKRDRFPDFKKFLPEIDDASRLMEHRYATDNDPRIQALYAGALVSWAEWEHQISPLPDGKRKHAISLYDGIFARYRDSQNPGVRAAAAKALLNKAGLMREEERLSIYDEIIQRYGEDDIPDVLAEVNKASLIQDMEKRLSRYDEIIQRPGEDEIPDVRAEVIRALLAKGEVLQNLGRYDEAVSHYDNSMRRPGWGDEWVKSSHWNHGHGPLSARILEEKGKVLEKQGKPRQAVAAYDQAIAVYDDAVFLDQAIAVVSGNTPPNWDETQRTIWNYSRRTNDDLLRLVCRVLIAKAAILRKQEDEQAANAVLENIDKRIEKYKKKYKGIGLSTDSFAHEMWRSICEGNDSCAYVFKRKVQQKP